MTEEICKPYGCQKNWFEFRNKCKEAGLDPNLELAKHLRLIADIIEKDDYPCVFGCEIMKIDESGKFSSNDFMGTVSVTLSYPWPG